MQKRAIGFLSVCAVVISATILSIPIAGLAGILQTASTASAAAAPTQLKIGFMQKVDSLNPYIGLNDASYVFYGLVFDGLGVIDNRMNPIPDLTKDPAWAVPTTDPEMAGMPYGSVWQYNLTPNAYWTDGEPFTADDVVFNIELNAKNYDAMWAYQPYSYYMKEAKKVDDYTVRVYFWDKITKEPMPASYAYLISIPMLPKHLLKDMDAYDIAFNWTGVFTEAQSPGMPIVGTGPFMSTPSIRQEWLAGDHITLVKNPRYHWKVDKGVEVKFDEVILKFYDESTAMTYALENKELDAAAFPHQAFRSIEKGVASGSIKNITTYDGPKITQYWTEIGISMSPGGPNPSRLDPVIRTAMHLATNKSYIVENYYLGLANPGTTIIPPFNSYWHYEPNASEKIDFNISAANALLDAYNYTRDTPGGLRKCTKDSPAVKMGLVSEGTTLSYQMLVRREYPEERDIAQYLEGQWAQIGIDVNYLILDEATMSTTVYTYNYDTMIWYWSADIDPNYQLFVFTTQAWWGWSDCKYSSPEYDYNYTMSVKTLNKTDRKVYVDNCQKVFYKDSAYILIAYVNQTWAWRDDTFSGWGDWGVDPGRSVDNFWMGNPLYFDLVPLNVQTGGGGIPAAALAIVIGAVVVVAVVVVVLLIMRGRKKGGALKEGGSPLGD